VDFQKNHFDIQLKRVIVIEQSGQLTVSVSFSNHIWLLYQQASSGLMDKVTSQGLPVQAPPGEGNTLFSFDSNYASLKGKV
jgi:hypothetical protein